MFVLGIFEIPTIDPRIRKKSFPITVICDNIRDPGNLGAVLRTVTAVGATQILLMKGEYNYIVIFVSFFAIHFK